MWGETKPPSAHCMTLSDMRPGVVVDSMTADLMREVMSLRAQLAEIAKIINAAEGADIVEEVREGVRLAELESTPPCPAGVWISW